MDQKKPIRLRNHPSLSSDPLLLLIGEAYEFVVQCEPSVTSLDFKINRRSQEKAKVDSEACSFSYIPKKQGLKSLRIDAFDGKKKLGKIEQDVLVIQKTEELALVGSFKDGANIGLSRDGSSQEITFVLTAPGKKFVHLIGELSSWELARSAQLKVDRSRGYERFWITLKAPSRKKEYAYQFVVDGEIRVADPFAKKVLAERDKEISRSVYPRLKKYPSDFTEEMVSVLDLRATPFDWTDQDFEPPETESLIVYEILLRDFTKESSFKSAIGQLAYLKSIGVNAIELMPIFEFEDNGSWGYNTIFYFAADRSYGPELELKSLINTAHSLGMAVILDIALNHNFGQSSLVRLYNEGKYGPPSSDNPWFNTFPTHDYNVGYDFNHESTFTQDLVQRVLNYWMDEFHVDGYRFDLSKGLTQKQTIGDMGAWAEYDAQRIARIESIADGVWENYPKAILILEHFSNNDEEIELAHYRVGEGFSGLLFWNNLNTKMGEAVMGYHDGDRSDLTSIDHRERNWTKANLLTYVESHDHDRLMHKARSYGAQNGQENGAAGYDSKDWLTALNRMKMAAAFFLLTPGPKMIWQFGELGYDQGSPLKSKLEGWIGLEELLSVKERVLLKEVYAALIHLRNSESLFTSSETVMMQESRDPLKYFHLKGSMMSAVILGNFGIERQERTIPLIRDDANVEQDLTTDWYDYFTGNSVQLNGRYFSISLEPGAFHILVDRPVHTPSQELLLWQTENGPDIYEGAPSIELDIRINSYTDSLLIRYSQEPSDHFSAMLYDRAGLKLIASLQTRSSSKSPSGLVSWKLPEKLKDGVYLVKCRFGNKRLSRRVYIQRSQFKK